MSNPAPASTGPSQRPALGILLMILSMAAFATADTLIKVVSDQITPPQTMFVLTLGSLVVFLVISFARRDVIASRAALGPVLLVRYVSEAFGMICMVLALKYVPLSVVGAIIQATPIFVMVGAVLFLGEVVSWRRWSAIIIGFVGVILIVQPGTDGFDASVLLALFAMVGLSVRDLTTRVTPPEMSSSALATYTMIALTPCATGWLLLSGDDFLPQNANWLIIAMMIGFGSGGYMLLIASIRMAEVSVVSPYRYSRLIFLLLFGIFIFEEKPGLLMLIGAAIVILSGIYMMFREQKVAGR